MISLLFDVFAVFSEIRYFSVVLRCSIIFESARACLWCSVVCFVDFVYNVLYLLFLICCVWVFDCFVVFEFVGSFLLNQKPRRKSVFRDPWWLHGGSAVAPRLLHGGSTAPRLPYVQNASPTGKHTNILNFEKCTQTVLNICKTYLEN